MELTYLEDKWDEDVVRDMDQPEQLRYRSNLIGSDLTSLQELEDVTDRTIDTLHIVGGGVRNELLTRWTADATRVQVIAGPIEATVIGNIGHQAMTSGHIRDLSEMRNRIDRSCDPDVYLPENTGYWDTHESTYRSLQEDV